MTNLFKKTGFFTLPYLVFLLLSGVILIVFSKALIHLYINRFHSPFFDLFFSYYTNVGDGLVPVLLSLFFLFFSFQKGLIIGLSSALAGLISQVFKRAILPGIVRPKVFFDGIANLYFVPGIEVHSSHSFPSGHTATAFCMFFILAYYTKERWLQFICFLGAFLVGYSRIYLSQHFLSDVYAGSIIGILSAVIIIFVFERSDKKWLRLSLIDIFNKKADGKKS